MRTVICRGSAKPLGRGGRSGGLGLRCHWTNPKTTQNSRFRDNSLPIPDLHLTPSMVLVWSLYGPCIVLVACRLCAGAWHGAQAIAWSEAAGTFERDCVPEPDRPHAEAAALPRARPSPSWRLHMNTRSNIGAFILSMIATSAFAAASAPYRNPTPPPWPSSANCCAKPRSLTATTTCPGNTASAATTSVPSTWPATPASSPRRWSRTSRACGSAASAPSSGRSMCPRSRRPARRAGRARTDRRRPPNGGELPRDV